MASNLVIYAFPECGHLPYEEKPEEFWQSFPANKYPRSAALFVEASNRPLRRRFIPNCVRRTRRLVEDMVPMHATISELVRVSLLIVGALFPIIDSPDNIPIFLTLTAGLSAESRAVLARKIAVNSFGILIVAVLIGTHILAFFGISLPVVQVGGGLIVIAAGWKLLNRPDDDAKAPRTSSKPLKDTYLTAYLARRAFYPLTMPLTVGPGSISVAIAVGASQALRGPTYWILPVAAFLGCAVIVGSVYLMYRFAEPIGDIVGDTAMYVVLRLSAFILVCIGVQIVWNGTSALLRTIIVLSPWGRPA
jgi:multiple antibiotic resistance protein